MNDYSSSLNFYSKTNFSKEESRHLCHSLMTTDPHMEQLVVRHFTPEDYASVQNRLIGTGKIGGKACGFLLARKLLQIHSPLQAAYLETHDSYYIGSDVFCDYILDNHCVSPTSSNGHATEEVLNLDAIQTAITKGTFSDTIRTEFSRMLKHYGNTPLIVRSSSFMEDSYQNAFSGKYESSFCANQGSFRKRLSEFEQAVQRVYASVFTPSAIKYRKKWGLLNQDEQMALLVQTVSGSRYGDFFFPFASGVGFSYNPYRWMEHINPDAGMLRLTAGLGTRAVSRTPGDYPRLVGLDRPQATTYPTTAKRHQYSQRYWDVMNLKTGLVEQRPWEDLDPLLPPKERRLLFSHDTDSEQWFLEQGKFSPVYFADCQGIVDQTPYIQTMKTILTTLEQLYKRPVDVEFALVLRDQETIGIHLLQCRPLQPKSPFQVSTPHQETGPVLFELHQASMRCSKEAHLDTIVLVDPEQYYRLPYQNKSRIAPLLGRINECLNNRSAMLLVPGRIGTSSPELGIPVSYAEICEFKVICEVSYQSAGCQPELSYGSHMFQDMVEADVFYAAINENYNTKCYQPEILNNYPNIYSQMLPSSPQYQHVIQIFDLTGREATLYLDAYEGQALCAMKKERRSK